MAVPPLIFVALLVVVTLRGLLEARSSFDIEKAAIKRQLKLINKPAIKSFTTKHGEIMDCVEIYKQRAFDNPLLKNYTIPKKYLQESSSSRRQTHSQLLPKDMICPKGTVMVKRVTEEDLAFYKTFSKSIAIGPKHIASNSSTTNDFQPSLATRNYALLFAPGFDNLGTTGRINVWNNYDLKGNQTSAGFIFVSSNDGTILQAGWLVMPSLYDDPNTRLYASLAGNGLGCVNNLNCEDHDMFVQTSQMTPIGMMLDKISSVNGPQYTLDVKIIQDDEEKHWKLYVGDEPVGHWPTEITDELKNGANQAGWGGIVTTAGPDPLPAMGSGQFPEQGFGSASFISNLELFGVHQFPDYDHLIQSITKRDCYKVDYKGVVDQDMGRTMYFGGPAGCV